MPDTWRGLWVCDAGHRGRDINVNGRCAVPLYDAMTTQEEPCLRPVHRLEQRKGEPWAQLAAMTKMRDAAADDAEALADARDKQMERADRAEAQLARLRETLSRLADVASEYSADQSEAKDERCGLVQPISVAIGEELNDALEQARAALAQPEEGKRDHETKGS